MKEYAEQFYSSKAWQRTRKAYAKSKQNLCEICLSKGIIKPGVIVHHKTHIDPANIHDPAITLAWDNLQLVCRDCHAAIHDKRQRRYTAIHDKRQRRYTIDEMGRVIPR